MRVPDQAAGQGPWPGLAKGEGARRSWAAGGGGLQPTSCQSVLCRGSVMPGCCHVFISPSHWEVCYMLTMTPVLWIK